MHTMPLWFCAAKLALHLQTAEILTLTARDEPSGNTVFSVQYETIAAAKTNGTERSSC